MEFDIWHDYVRAVDEELISPLRCNSDGWKLNLQANKDDEPILHCYMCGSNLKPGLDLLARVKNLLESIPVDK